MARDEFAATLPIGAITQELEFQLPHGVEHLASPQETEAIAAVYADFDSRFGDRPDYRLWRTGLTPYFAARRRALFPREACANLAWGPWFENAMAATESDDPVIVWSAVALAPEIIQRRLQEGELGQNAAIWPFAERLYSLLFGGLAPLPSSQASCGLAAVMFLIRHQNLHYRAGQNLDAKSCQELFKKIHGWFLVSDPTWELGRKLNVDAVIAERRGSTRLRPGHPTHEFSVLTNMLAIIRPTISLSIHEMSPTSEALLMDAYKYGLTAWLTARSRRIDEMQYQASRWSSDVGRGKWKVRRAFIEEFECHLKLSNAARDAGQYLESGKLLYLLFRLIPDEFLDLPEVQRELKGRKGLMRKVKEVGLEPDPRFETERDSAGILARRETIHATRKKQWRGKRGADIDGAVAVSSSVGHLSAPLEKETGFALRVRRDQAILSDWRVLLAEIPPGPNETPVGFLLTVSKGLADSGLPASPQALAAAFRLCLRYGYVRSGGKILARSIEGSEFELTSMMLMDFVHNVRRCTQLDPFGVRQIRLANWQKLIRDGCSLLYQKLGSDWMEGADRLWIHEALNNRIHVHHAGLNTANARRLFEKSAGIYDVDDLREFYDLQYDFGRRAPGAANIDTISAWLQQFSEARPGPPVAISLVQMGTSVSILAIGKDGTVVADDCPAPTLGDDVTDLLRESEFWFKLANVDPAREIGWPASLRRVAARIVGAARTCDPDARVLLMSMDSSLARLPWQNLMNLGASPTKRLVSIVPSFSAFTLRDRSELESGLTTILSDDSGTEIAAVVGSVRETTRGIDFSGASVCIAAGHASLPESGGLPVFRLGPERVVETLDDWLGLLKARVNIFHCCHSGVPLPVFMEEFGGIAGMAMYLGAKSFLAPVGEVYPSMAATIQRCLFHRPTVSIGSTYLDAIAQNPGCCLYNLYGNPFEAILPPVGPAIPAVGSAAKAAAA